jgi:CheY-like chemotaxis protein
MSTIGRPLRVLIADDEHVIADTLAIIFRNSGFDAKSVYSGYSAIETAVDFQPDVVISDIVMPSLGGVETILSIWRQCPNCRFLLMTGNANRQDALHRACGRGLQLVCLHKPVPPQLLIEYLTDCALQHDRKRLVTAVRFGSHYAGTS